MAQSMYPLRPDRAVDKSYSIEIILIEDGKVVERREVKVPRFMAYRIYKSTKTLVECAAR